MDTEVQNFWQHYLDSLSPSANHPKEPKEIFAFGDSPEMADNLGRLVQQGIKTGTCSALSCYAAQPATVPEKSDFAVVLDGKGVPIAVIEFVEVFISSYIEVSEQFAFEEGEGDRSLAYWRAEHRAFFTRTIPSEKLFDERMLLVCQRFEVVWPKQ